MSRSFLIRVSQTCIILSTLFSSVPLFAELLPNSHYSRDVAYIGGLSTQLFSSERTDVTIATEMFFTEVIKRIGFHGIEFKVWDDKTDILKEMREDRLDTIFANPIDYLDLDHQVNPAFRYSLTYGSTSKAEQRVYLLTHLDNSITDIHALSGSRLTIPNGYRLGYTYLEVFLAKAGLPPPEAFFTTILSPSTSNAAVLDIFFDKADLAVTSDIAYNLAVELNPQIRSKIGVIAISDPYLPFIIGVNRQVPEQFAVQVDDVLMHLQREPRLRHILSLFSATNVVKVDSEQLETLRRLKWEHEQLIQGK